MISSVSLLAHLHTANGHRGADIESLYRAVEYHDDFVFLSQSGAQDKNGRDDRNQQGADNESADGDSVGFLTHAVSSSAAAALRVRNCLTTAWSL